MTIVEFIKSIALACTGKAVSFGHGWPEEKNLQDETAIFPYIWLLHGIGIKGKMLPQSNSEKEYTLDIIFFNRARIDDNQADRQPFFDELYTVIEEFLTRVDKSTYVEKVIDWQTKELINQDDLNTNVIWLTLKLKVVGTASTCIAMYLVNQDGNYVTDQNGNKIKI